MPLLNDPPWHHGLTVFERGWLSSNNVLLHGTPGEPEEGAVLVDSSHTLHAEQTVAMMRQQLGSEHLRRVVNTHLHSDHCGGNAALARAFAGDTGDGCRIDIPPGHFQEALRWDTMALSHASTGQVCERFVPDGCIHPGEVLAVGSRRWLAIAAPGHDPHSLIFFDEQHGVLISADALWGNGFGVVFPELDGEEGFADVARVLDLIERLAPRHVIPGHGAPFADVPEALARARSRLASWRREPLRHLQHGAKVLLKYHLMEVREQEQAELEAWAAGTALVQRTWERLGQPAGSVQGWSRQLVDSLLGAGALLRRGRRLLDV